MKKHTFYTFDDHFKELMKNPSFKKEWDDSESERLLGSSLMNMIIKRKTDYKKLATRTKISRVTISEIILGNANPKLSILKNLL